MMPACPSCGYDFPAERDGASVRGRAAGLPAATVALGVGAVGAGLGAAWTAVKAVASVFQGQFEVAVVAAFVCTLLVGFLGVFLRLSGR
ncbi:hypothetical protein [Gemmata sp.]|uniref:hypothetical protein n=1 Tax=Gemmata sp. TaxID=1914242 RepID=UPI003F6FE0AA